MTNVQRAAWGLCVAAALVSTRDAHAQPLACIAEGTPAERVAEQIIATAGAMPQAANVDDRWDRTATDGDNLSRGEPITLTWAVVADGTRIIPAISGESTDDSDLRAYLADHYGSEVVWQGHIQDALDGWSTGPGITFVHETEDDGVRLNRRRGVLGVRADIRIGGHDIDGNRGTVAYAFFPSDGGDMVIDTNDSYNTTLGRLKNVVAHEAGHAIGLGHVCPTDATKLMEPIVSTSFSGPQFDDLLGAHRNYGDVEEENDGVGQAADLGLAIDTTTDVTSLALDGQNDDDWFALPTGTRSEVSIALAPAGNAYLFATESDGDCSGVSTSTFDPRETQDLNLAIYDFDGTTLLASADATTAGGSESITDLRVSSFGGFFQVSGSGINDAQVYEIEITLVPEPATFALQGVAVGAVGMLTLRARRRDSSA
ncbi:MAG: matrixin family metalloprotease [bacterium]|nr:matrixin family metalloprotease [bacterium]